MMFDIDTVMTLQDDDGEKDVTVRIEVESMTVVPPDPTTWASDMDYYGYREADYTAYRMDTGEEVEIDEKTFWSLMEAEMERDKAY